jgi:hypothetical protein
MVTPWSTPLNHNNNMPIFTLKQHPLCHIPYKNYIGGLSTYTPRPWLWPQCPLVKIWVTTRATYYPYGVGISRAVGASRAKIVALFILLSVCDIFCTYNEIRSVVFNSLNLERASIVLNKYFTLKRATEQQTRGVKQERK